MLMLAMAALPGASSAPPSAQARHYYAYWLWSGVRPQPVLKSAKRIYLLQGQVEARLPVRLVAQRPATPHTQGPEIWMVIRAETLDWPPEVSGQILAAIGRWRAAGNDVAGVQIDFDAATRHLDRYAAFLTTLRRRLPAGLKLGVTGLLDWSSNADPAGLDALTGTVDEIVIQTYQGRHVIPGYAAYLTRLESLRMPFRIGLLQGAEWQPPAGLESNPNFRGYVLFLRNPG
jgi:Protein of unknown function (DUF3142)